MRIRTAAISFLMVMFVLGAFPGRAAAEDGESAAEVKSKRKRGGKKRGGRKKKARSADDQVDTDPYGDATVESQGEPAAAEEVEEQETGSDEAVDETSDTSAPEGSLGSLRRSNRMEFDERLIKGQAAKSGAVYLFKRVPRALPGLVPMRRSYRRRIVEPVLGMRKLKPVRSGTDDEEEAEVITSESKKADEAPSPEEQAADSASEATPPEEETKDKKQNGQGRKRRGGKK